MVNDAQLFNALMFAEFGLLFEQVDLIFQCRLFLGQFFEIMLQLLNVLFHTVQVIIQKFYLGFDLIQFLTHCLFFLLSHRFFLIQFMDVILKCLQIHL